MLATKYAKHGMAFLSLLLISGCSGDTVEMPPVATVSGTVMYNGKAVEGASVRFETSGAPRVGTGITDAAGKFQVSTFGANDGAIVGEHVICVTKLESSAAAAPGTTEANMNDPAAMAQMMEVVDGEGQLGPKSLLPVKYGSATTSTLKETVVADTTNVFVLQLVD